MRLSKICDAGGFRIRKVVAAHGRESALGRDSCTDCYSGPSTLMNLVYIQVFYTSREPAQDCQEMSKDSRGPTWTPVGMMGGKTC